MSCFAVMVMTSEKKEEFLYFEVCLISQAIEPRSLSFSMFNFQAAACNKEFLGRIFYLGISKQLIALINILRVRIF